MVLRPMALAAIWLAGALAQAPSDLFEKAPPQLDEALRTRVTRFYQAHVEGKFRIADQYVAEDSKDAFFSADKKKYRGFEVTKITYSDNFTKARVVTTVDDEFVNPLGRYQVKMPLTTLWKLDQGEWFWYVVPMEGAMETPFGKMKAGEGGSSVFVGRIPDAQTILRQVQVDRVNIQLSSVEAGAEEATVKNGMPGSISLSLSYNGFPGFEARLDKQTLAAGESAKVLITSKPKDRTAKPTITLNLTVEPTGRVIPIRVTFAIPPEVEEVMRKR